MADLRSAILAVLVDGPATTTAIRDAVGREPYEALRELRAGCLVTSRPARGAVRWTITDAGRVVAGASHA